MFTLNLAYINKFLLNCPSCLISLLQAFPNKVFVAGGCLRATVANEPINDFDLFVDSKETAAQIDKWVGSNVPTVVAGYTNNAATYHLALGKRPIQVITRWLYKTGQDVIESFDFTICQAAIWWDGTQFASVRAIEFYSSVTEKFLSYTSPVRDEEPAGSMLRAIKFIKQGYRIDKHNLAKVIARVAYHSLTYENMTETEQVEAIHHKLCEATHVRY